MSLFAPSRSVSLWVSPVPASATLPPSLSLSKARWGLFQGLPAKGEPLWGPSARRCRRFVGRGSPQEKTAPIWVPFGVGGTGDKPPWVELVPHPRCRVLQLPTHPAAALGGGFRPAAAVAQEEVAEGFPPPAARTILREGMGAGRGSGTRAKVLLLRSEDQSLQPHSNNRTATERPGVRKRLEKPWWLW